MKKQLPIVSLLAVFVILGGLSCGAQKPAATVNVNAVGGTKVAQDVGEPLTGSIESFMKLGRSIRCVLQQADGAIVSGTTYVSGTKARSDFQTKVGESLVNGHFIVDSTTMYSWTDGTPSQAVKFSLADMQNPNFKSNSGDQADSYNTQMAYKCYNWSADNSYFTPPSNINFTDFSEMMKALQNFKTPGTGTGTGNSALCASCDQITDVKSKAQCKVSLGCK